MMTIDRAAHREAMRAKHAEWRKNVENTVREGTQDEICEMVRKTNLAYIWGRKPIEHTLDEDGSLTVHHENTMTVIGCKAKMKGWLFINVQLEWDKLIRVDDEWAPAPEAKVIGKKIYQTFCVIVDVNGVPCLAEAFRVLEEKFLE